MTEKNLMNEISELVTALLDSRGCMRNHALRFEGISFCIQAGDALDLPTRSWFLREDWRELGDFSGEITIQEVTPKGIVWVENGKTTSSRFIRFPFRVTEGRVVVPGRYATHGHRFSRQRLQQYAEWASRAAAHWQPSAEDRRSYECIGKLGVADGYATERSLRAYALEQLGSL